MLSACSTDDKEITASIYTEDILFSSGDRALMTGRVLSVDDLNIIDHGFEVAKSEDFSQAINLSLGSKDQPGRFVGEVKDLETTESYFVRAYMDIGAGVEYGNVLSFSTVASRIIDFEPKFGNANMTITVEGANFTSDSYILWNDLQITPTDIRDESFIDFKVPAIDMSSTATIKVVSQNETLSFSEEFEYIIGEWKEIGTIDDPYKNNRHVYFEDQNSFYYGLGVSAEFDGVHGNLYKVNKSTLERELISNVVPAREGSFFTSSGYIGSGSNIFVKNSDNTLNLNGEFYKWDGNTAIALANIPKALYRASAVEIGNSIYVLGGEDLQRNDNYQMFRYDISSDVWQALGDAPIKNYSYLPYFGIDNSIYLISESGEMYAYDTQADNWERKASYPDVVQLLGESIVIGNKAYVGLQDNSRKIYEYLSEEDRWKNLKSFNAFTQPTTSLGHWTSDDKIYLMRTNFGSGTERYFWEFDPYGF